LLDFDDNEFTALVDKEVEEFKNKLEEVDIYYNGCNKNNTTTTNINHNDYSSGNKIKLPVARDVFMAAVVGAH